MSKPLIYLDNAATTPLASEALAAMQPFLGEIYGNPSSLHATGKAAARALKQAQNQLAELMGATGPEDLIMTSGATEANNLALKGLAFGRKHQGRHLITSRIEHPSVLDPCTWLESEGWQVTYLPVDEEGFVSPADLTAAIRSDTVLVSLMHGNNEVGTVQDIYTLGSICREHGVLFHTDAVQTVGKLPLNLGALPVDLLSASAHKFYGPKGIGFLYANAAARQTLSPWLHGGGQQNNLRSGTENLAGLVGMVAALHQILYEQSQMNGTLKTLQNKLWEGISAVTNGAVLNGPKDWSRRVPGNINVSFPPVEGEALVLRFDLAGIQVSSGSACHSAQLEGSHVLYALGASPERARSSIRFSLGRHTTAQEIDAVLETLPRVLERAGYFRKVPVGVQ